MRAIKWLIGAIALAAALLVSGCGTTPTQPVNLADPASVSKLCGQQAHDIANEVATDANASVGSGKRNELRTKYNLDPANDQQITAVRAQLDKAPKDCPSSAPTTAPPTPTPTPSPAAACDPQFKQVVIGNGTDGKAVEDFSKRFADVAATPDGTPLTKDQQQRFLNLVASNAHLLAYYAHGFGLQDDPNKVDGLATADCLSQKGQTLFHQLEGVVLTSAPSKGQADPGLTNSGLDGGKAVVAKTPGIAGDRTSIQFKLKNGKTVTIMWVCGNLAFEEAPANVPTSTLIPQPQPTTPEVPVTPQPTTPEVPVTPQVPEAKNPAQDPAPRGNAGNGGGVNADPGPGTYVPPAQMQQPPAAPRQNPAPPAAQPGPVQGSGGTTVPAPNPNPAPVTPAPVEPQVNPSPQPGATTPPRSSGDPGTPSW